MIRYVKYQNKSNIAKVNGKWFLRIVQTGETYDIAKLAAHMADHASGFTKGQITGILTDMVACIRELLLDGKKVKIADLALFSLGCSCHGADDPSTATVANIRRIYINARGTGEFSTRDISEKVRLKEQDAYSL